MTLTLRIHNTASSLTALLFALVLAGPVYAVPNGTVVMAKGIVTATATDQTNRILGKGAEVNEGDTINTAEKSFAVIRMIDKTKFTLKPSTTMILGEFNTKEGEEIACVNLVKGGLRTVTGLIGQRRPDAVQLDTPIASIGIRGTDFITLICQDDAECSGEEPGYDDGQAESSKADEQREAVIESIPQGLYSSCETGTVVLSKCAGQAAGYQPGKCRINQQRDCIDLVLNEGQSAYTSYGKKEFKEEGEGDGEKKAGGESGDDSGDDSGSDSGGDSGSDSGGDSGSDSGGDSGSDSGGDSGGSSESGSGSDSRGGSLADSGTVSAQDSRAVSAQDSRAAAVQGSEILESKPGIISNDPYFKLSDLSDSELESINLLIEEASGGIDNGYTPGATSCAISG